MRKVFLDDLPKFNSGINIDWKRSVGSKVKFIYHDIEGEIEIVDYNKEFLTLKYNNNICEKKIKTGNFSNCQLGSILNKKTNKFRYEIGENIIDERRNIKIKHREYRKNSNGDHLRWYQYTCQQCGWQEGWIEESKIRIGRGCSCCSGKTVVPEINSIWAKASWMMKWISEEDAKGYTPQSGKKIKIKCPDCGRVKNIRISSIYRRKSISCSCGDGFSYPSKIMNSILNQLNISFEQEYSPKYLVMIEKGKRCQKRSDFYLPDYNLIIEVDGGIGHKGGIVHGKSNKTIDELIKIDKWKEKQHNLYGIRTIRIDCHESDIEYIKNKILNSELSKIFELNEIDWDRCEEFALKNIVKEVCIFWKEVKDLNLTTANLSSIFGYSRTTIINYLKRGDRLGWCSYSGDREAIKSTKRKSKPVYMYGIKGEFMGRFESIHDLERASESLFGISLNSPSISQCCNGKLNQYKGFTFKYVEE